MTFRAGVLDLWVLIEVFADGDAGKAHVESAHFKAAMETLPRLLADVPEIVNVEVPGWARMSELRVETTDGSN